MGSPNIRVLLADPRWEALLLRFIEVSGAVRIVDKVDMEGEWRVGENSEDKKTYAFASIDPLYHMHDADEVRSSAPKIAAAKRTAGSFKARARTGVKSAAVAKGKKATDVE